MRIALNLLYLIPDVVGGTQTYAMELIRALAALDTQNEYLLLVNREAAQLPLVDAPNFRRVVCPVQARRRPVRYAWEQSVLPALLLARRVQLVHSLGYVGPLATPCRHVVTIYDLNYLGHQSLMTSARRNVLSKIVPRVAHAADHVLTASEFSRQQIAQHIGLPPDKITVTLGGTRTLGSETSGDWSEIARNYGIVGPYAIAFGSRQPHKNLERLLEAFTCIQADVPHTLVLVGHLPEGTDLRTQIAKAGLASRVIVTGYVPDAHVMPLIANADLFVFPSLYEGFGLPALDAQGAGVALACSTAGSLPEVAGAGAVYFDPCSVEEMAAKMRLCLTNPELRTELVAKGKTNLARFSWQQTARLTLDVYERLNRNGRTGRF